MNPAVQKVIDAAKQVVVVSKLQVIELDEVLMGLAVLRDHEDIASGVAECLGVETVRWPNGFIVVAHQCARAGAEGVLERKFELGPLFKKIYNHLLRQGRDVSLSDFLKGILTSPDAMTCQTVATFHAHQQKENLRPQPASMLARLRDLAQQGRELRSILAQRVIGQEDAITMLTEGYLRSIRAKKTSGLRGIFTFMGPPGVGKTMLAEQFAHALAQVEGKPCETQTFSMEMGGDESLLFTIFGLDSAYGKAKNGVLYHKIKENPRQVILFDEIEKAPGKIIQSLLTLLNNGSFRDGLQQELVDLSQCFVIFTTNLGQDLFASRNRSGILRGSEFTADDLFDLLATAKRRGYAGHSLEASVLSPEFVNRLRKGGAVLFNQLSGSDYLKLLDRCLQPMEESQVSPNLPPVWMGTDAKKLFILSLLPDLSPRRIQGECETLMEKWIADILVNPPAGLEAAEPDRFEMVCELALDAESETLRKRLGADQKLKILVADNDHRMALFIQKFVSEKYGEISLTVERADDPAGVVDEILRTQPDLLMLDLDFPDEALPEGGILALHRRIMEGVPSLPIVLFSESPDWVEKLPTIIAQGGARGFFAFREESSHDINISDDLQEKFRVLLDDTLFEKIMANNVRTRRKLDLAYRYDFEAGSNTVVAGICRIKHRQIVSLADDSGGIRPSEIPSVTFDDVFGLERAKERLRDAVEFMKNPGCLSAFGIRPPSGFLLAGPSGTGKTHLARAVANAAGCVFYALSAGELESKWVGEGEERIRKLFAAARQYAPAVIFIDEIDAIASQRNENGAGHSVKMLNQLLVCMDGFSDTKGQVLVLAATNRPETLDPAIVRPGRFDETIRIEAPDSKAREQMLRKRIGLMPCAPGILDAIPRLICRTAGFSPAEVDRMLREAVYLAVRQKRPNITLDDIESAANLVRYGANRRDVVVREGDRLRTAWHEAGHAIARLTLFPGSKIDYLSIVPNETGALGFAAWQKDETKHAHSADDYRNLIIVALAGREAEKLCPEAGTDAINTGVSSDYQFASALAWDYVARYGFDENFGVFCAAGAPEPMQSSLANMIHPHVQSLLSSCLSATRGLMEENISRLQTLVAVLLEKEAIYGEEVENLVRGPLDPQNP